MEIVEIKNKSNLAREIFQAIFEYKFISLEEGEKLCDLLDANRLEEAIKKFKELLYSTIGCPWPI